MNYESLLAVITLLYLTQVGLFFYGLCIRRNGASNTAQPPVSVIVAARNEEHSIAECLASLCHQSYPRERYEVVVVDDHSEDSTREVVMNVAAREERIKLIQSVPESSLRGKTNALATGIRESTGEIVMITDADCTVPPTWIEETVRRYESRVGIVGGMTLQSASDWFGGMQSLDWAYLLGIASAAVGLGNPLSTIGNNLSFRREAYNQVGGYEGIPFSITEDYSLFQAIVRTGTWNVAYPLDHALLVISKPCKSWGELVRQKHRWGKGGLDMKLSGFLIMAIGFTQHLMILAGPLLYGAVSAALTGWFVKAVGDYAFLHAVLRRVRRLDQLKYFLAFQIYYLLYVLALPFIVFFRRRVVWKGRSY